MDKEGQSPSPLRDESRSRTQAKERVLHLRSKDVTRILSSSKVVNAVHVSGCRFVREGTLGSTAIACKVEDRAESFMNSDYEKSVRNLPIVRDCIGKKFTSCVEEIGRRGDVISYDDLEGIVSAVCEAKQVDVSQALNLWLQAGLEKSATESFRLAKPPFDLPFTHAFTAGGIAGAIAKTTIAPLDRVKILYQIDPSKLFSLRSALFELRNIVKHEGLFKLWRGNGAMLLRVIPYASIQFSTFEGLKKVWSSYNERPTDVQTPLSRFIIGAMAGSVSVMCTYPLDLMRAKLAAQRGSSVMGYFSTMKHTAQTSGVRGLFRGLQVTLLGIVPYAGTSFMTFETLKSIVLKRSHDEHLSNMSRLQCGAFAGLLAQTSTYPLDIVRRRLQVHGHVTGPTGEKLDGVLASLRSIYRGEGVSQGLYKGVAMNWIKGPIATAISFTVYDALKTYFRESHSASSGS